MKIKLTGSSYLLLALIVLMLIVVIQALSMPFYSKLFPLMLGIAIFVLGAIRFRKEIQPGDKTKTDVATVEPGETGGSQRTWRGYSIAEAWIVGYLLAIVLLGFVVASPLLVLSFMKTRGVGWGAAVISTILTVIVVYFGGQVALGIDFYPGILFILLGGR